jgi:hypothetical protein
MEDNGNEVVGDRINRLAGDGEDVGHGEEPR